MYVYVCPYRKYLYEKDGMTENNCQGVMTVASCLRTSPLSRFPPTCPINVSLIEQMIILLLELLYPKAVIGYCFILLNEL